MWQQKGCAMSSFHELSWPIKALSAGAMLAMVLSLTGCPSTDATTNKADSETPPVTDDEILVTAVSVGSGLLRHQLGGSAARCAGDARRDRRVAGRASHCKRDYRRPLRRAGYAPGIPTWRWVSGARRPWPTIWRRSAWAYHADADGQLWQGAAGCRRQRQVGLGAEPARGVRAGELKAKHGPLSPRRWGRQVGGGDRLRNTSGLVSNLKPREFPAA